MDNPKSKILVAEDDLTNYTLVEEIFEQINATLLHANNGLEAIQLLKENKDISLVLMDIKMPLMDGIEATRELKKIKPELPIIALTAYALAKDMKNAFDAGCDGFLTKPINTGQLLLLLDKHLI